MKKTHGSNCITVFSLLSCVFLIFSVQASELTYTPVNPNFGGSPLNGNFLMSNANAQNNYKDPDSSSSSYVRPTSLERFASSLESRLLSQLMTDIGNGNTGSLATDDYIIDIVDDSGTLTVKITDLATNETTEIEVNGLDPNN